MRSMRPLDWGLGQDRGVPVSSSGARGVWSRHKLLAKHERLLRLKETAAKRKLTVPRPNPRKWSGTRDPAEARLVYADPADIFMADLGPGLVHVMLKHPPEPCIDLPDESGCDGHRHALPGRGSSPRRGVCNHCQSGPRALPQASPRRPRTTPEGPGHGRRLHAGRSPGGATSSPWCRGPGNRPCRTWGRENRPPWRRYRYRPCLLDIELRPIHVPGRLEAHRHLKEIRVSHPNPTHLPRWPSNGPGGRAAPGSGDPRASPPQPTHGTAPFAMPVRRRYPSRTD